MVRKRFCSLAKSACYMVAFICLMLEFIGGIVNIFCQFSNLNRMSYFYSGGAEYISAIFFVLMFIGFIPNLLRAIGMIIFTVKSRNESAGGLGAVKAAQIISMIFTIMLGVMVTVALIIGVASSGMSADEMAPIFVALFVLVAVFVLSIIYHSCTISSISVGQGAIENNKLQGSASLFVAVFNFMGGFFSMLISLVVLLVIFGVLNNIPNMYMYIAGFDSGLAIASYIGSFAGGLATFMFGILIIKARQIPASDSDEDEVSAASDYANFCVFCGKPLVYGEMCTCREEVKNEEIPDKEHTRSTICIYCGKTLAEGEKCDCKASADLAEETATAEPAYKEFCIYCGKTLTGGEKCSCRTEVTDSFCTNCGRAIKYGEICECKKSFEMPTGGSRLKSTMRDTSADSPEEAAKKEEGRKFFTGGGDL